MIQPAKQRLASIASERTREDVTVLRRALDIGHSSPKVLLRNETSVTGMPARPSMPSEPVLRTCGAHRRMSPQSPSHLQASGFVDHHHLTQEPHRLLGAARNSRDLDQTVENPPHHYPPEEEAESEETMVFTQLDSVEVPS